MNFSVWSDDMMERWQQTQRQYWENLTSQATKRGDDKDAVPDLANMLEQWWSLFGARSPEFGAQHAEAAQRIFDIGKFYAQLLENMPGEKANNAKLLENWFTAVEKGLKALAENFTGAGTDDHFARFVPGLQMMQDWQKLYSNSGNIPQEQLQPLSDLAAKYRDAMQAYMSACSLHGLDSLQALRKRMELMGKEGYSVDSMRELYELWVDVSEEVYSKFARSEQYQVLHGDLMNAFVALRGGMNTMLESQLQALQIPTRSDFDKVLQQMQQLKRENAELAQRIAALENATTETEQNRQTAAAEDSEDNGVAKEKTEAAEQPAQVKTAETAAKVTEESVDGESVENTASVESATAAVEEASAIPAPTVADTNDIADKTLVTEAPVTEKPAADPDDLTRIKGVGPKMGEKLIDAGIQTFDQLAALSAAQIQELDSKLDARGRLLRDDWAGQAAKLAETRLA